jgi:hypothetical protein
MRSSGMFADLELKEPKMARDDEYKERVSSA